VALHAYEARFPFKRNRLRCVNENRKKRKRLRGSSQSAIAFEWKPGLRLLITLLFKASVGEVNREDCTALIAQL